MKSISPSFCYNHQFRIRVLGLIRGLTASLDVSQSYLEVMTPYARKALRDLYQQQQQQQDGEFETVSVKESAASRSDIHSISKVCDISSVVVIFTILWEEVLLTDLNGLLHSHRLVVTATLILPLIYST